MNNKLKHNLRKIKDLGINKYIDILYFFPKKVSFLECSTLKEDSKEGIFGGNVYSNIKISFHTSVCYECS